VLDKLHTDVRVLARQGGAQTSELAALSVRFPELPATFLNLFGSATERELSYRGAYIRFYGPRGCLEMDRAYQISARIPGAVVVGDNGGGEAIVFMPASPGPGLFRVGYGVLVIDELIPIAPSPEALLVHALPDPASVGSCRAP
jgi:hypothetical protein